MTTRKPISLTAHAEDAILERKIDGNWIERTVWKPEWYHPDPQRPGVERRFRVIPELGGRVLRVACLETADEIRILTVFFDRDARDPS
ncbi:DUF4258 domain-containing protein [Bradyrhizobium sp.]|jgi:hypothetical protein|uniref:DUF4258 domain-containing protein n=1 Tax=Bradyrhizobium sp. TaxID=376 RepID=UPI002DFCC615|nr:DUF4258 domain-containing protein [Bradyrhizobium sp.]